MDNKSKFSYFWQNVVESNGSALEDEVSKFMNFFCELLEIERVYSEQGDGFYISYLDMSSIQMKVSETAPFFVARISMEDEHEINNLFLKIKNKIYENNFQNHVCFITVIGMASFFKTLCKDSLLDLVVLDKKSINQVAESQKPRSAFIKICKEQINVQRLSPYEIVDPVVGRMFYGRKEEMKKLVKREDINFVITGCRKVGKSSLILSAYNQIRKEANTFPLFLDCHSYKTIDGFVKQVVTRLEISELRRMTVDKFHDFLRRMKKKYQKRITFILDEADGLLANDKNYDWTLFNILCAAHAEGYCRFILTGYRTVFEESRNLNSPLYRFLEQIRIHDLDHDSAVALITQPIRDMGILFQDTGKIIDEIIKQTSRQPNLIQFICKKLVEIESKRNTNLITFNDLLEVEKSSEYRHYITDTFIINTTSFEALTVYCMVNYVEFNLKDIDEELLKREIFLKVNELERICTILEMANVLYKIDGKYRFSNPALPKILKEDYDMDFMIKKLSMEVKQNDHGKPGNR